MTLPYSTQAGKLAFQEATALYRSLNYRIGDFKALRGLSADLKQLSSIRTGARAATNPISTAYKKLEFDISKSNKKISGIQKVTDALKKGAFREINPKWGAALNVLLNVAMAGVTLLSIKSNEAIQTINLANGKRSEADLQDAFTRGINNSIQIRGQQKQIEALRLGEQRVRDRIYATEKEQIKQRQTINDITYEVRQGRRIVEQKISEQGQRITSINNEVKTAIQGINTNTQNAIKNAITDLQTRLRSANDTIAKLNSDIANRLSGFGSQLTSLQSTVNSIKKPTPVDTASLVTSARNAAQQEVAGLRNQVSTLQSALNAVSSNVGGIQQAIPTLSSGINTAATTAKQAQSTADAALREAKNKGLFDTSSLQRELDAKFNQFVQQNNQALKIKDLQLSDLSRRFDQEFSNFQRQSQLTADQRFSEFVRSNNEALKIRDLTTSNLSKEFDSKLQQFQNTTNSRLGNIEKVNEQGNKRLDEILPKINQILPTLAGLPLIVARATSDQLRPDIPTISGIEAATGRAMCRNLQTGCGRQAIDDAIGNINQHNTNNTGSVLDALNTGANAAQITLLNTINGKLGDAIPGGIGGKLNKLASWLQLDRLLNLLTFAATVHNAAQLTSDIAVTLGSALGNVLSLIGIKNDDGGAIDVGQIINSTVENLVKGIIGESQYKQFSEAWAKANRIYQATANVANSFTNIGHTILNGLEIVGGNTGKIGNALRIWGAVGENAYNWMNPQPNYHSRIFQFFEKAQNTASTVQQVTQVPLDVISSVTEFNNSTKELVDSVTQKPETTQGQDVGDAETVKEQRDAAKIASVGAVYDITDLFDAND